MHHRAKIDYQIGLVEISANFRNNVLKILDDSIGDLRDDPTEERCQHFKRMLGLAFNNDASLLEYCRSDFQFANNYAQLLLLDMCLTGRHSVATLSDHLEKFPNHPDFLHARYVLNSQDENTQDESDLLIALKELDNTNYTLHFKNEILGHGAVYYERNKQWENARQCYLNLYSGSINSNLNNLANCERQLLNWQTAIDYYSAYFKNYEDKQSTIADRLDFLHCLQRLKQWDEIAGFHNDILPTINYSHSTKMDIVIYRMMDCFFQNNFHQVIQECQEISGNILRDDQLISVLTTQIISECLVANKTPTTQIELQYEQLKKLLLTQIEEMDKLSVSTRDMLERSLVFFYLAEMLLGKVKANKHWHSSVMQETGFALDDNEETVQQKLELLLLVNKYSVRDVVDILTPRNHVEFSNHTKKLFLELQLGLSKQFAQLRLFNHHQVANSLIAPDIMIKCHNAK